MYLRKGGYENRCQRPHLPYQHDGHEEISPVYHVRQPANQEGRRGAEPEEGDGDVAPQMSVLLKL